MPEVSADLTGTRNNKQGKAKLSANEKIVNQTLKTQQPIKTQIV